MRTLWMLGAAVLGLAGARATWGEPAALSEPVKAPEGAVVLFDGKDASGWGHDGDKPCGWKLADGALEAQKGSGDLISKQTFQDFQLHVEFWLPMNPPDVKGQKRSNSGVYLQRRYEVQVLDSYGIEKPAPGDCGGIYGQKAADVNACTPPETWQAYDITFRAARFDAEGKKTGNARVTVVHNGVKIHDDVEIKDKTGGGRPEGPEAGPILLQDHGNPVRYRNVWVVPAAGSKEGAQGEKSACACGGACKCGHCSSGGKKACGCKK